MRDRKSPEAFVDLEERSEYTDSSSIIDMEEIGHSNVDLLSYDQTAEEKFLPLTLNSYQEQLPLSGKREHVAGNLGNISEEAEVSQHPSQQSSLQDVVIPDNAGSRRNSKDIRRFAELPRKRLASLAESVERKAQETDTNNNADRQSSDKKQSNIPSRRVTAPVVSVQQQPSTDVLSQILETAGPAPPTSRPMRRSSTFMLGRRSSAFGVPSSLGVSASAFGRLNLTPKSRLSATERRETGKTTANRMGKVDQQASSVRHHSGTGSTLRLKDYLRVDSTVESIETVLAESKATADFVASDKQDNVLTDDVRLPASAVVGSGKVIGKTSTTKDAQASRSSDMKKLSRHASISKVPTTTSQLLEDVKEVVEDTVNVGPGPSSKLLESGSKSQDLLKTSQGSSHLWTDSDYTHSEAASTAGSHNDSEESVELRKFQAALKQGFYMPGQTPMEREKNMLHSIFEYRRRSIFDDYLRTERYDSLASDGKGHTDFVESTDTRHSTRPAKQSKSMVADLRGIDEQRDFSQHKFSVGTRETLADRQFSTRSHDQLPFRLTNKRSLKYGSQLSMVDISMLSDRGKQNGEGTSVKRSVLNLDPRLRDTNDTRFATADRVERVKAPDHAFSLTAMQDNQFLNMTLSAASGATGPFKRRSSKVESAAKIRTLPIDAKTPDSLSVPTRVNVPPVAPRKSLKFDDIEFGKQSIGVQTSSDNKSLDLEIDLPLQTGRIRTSYDTGSQIRAQFRGVSGTLSHTHIAPRRRSSSPSDQYFSALKRKSTISQYRRLTSPVTPVTPPTESLTPLVAPLSGTVLPSLVATTSSRSLSKKLIGDSQNLDSDFESILRVSHSGYAGFLTADTTGYRKKGRHCEVKVINLGNGDCNTFLWGGTTIQLCKYLPDTHSSSTDFDRMLYSY